jgi:hypothetical protein
MTYQDQLLIGQNFQEYVKTWLRQELHITLENFEGKQMQLLGENFQGIEIKRDGQFRRTQQLYIEVAEKTHPDNPNYILSGCFREDNSWLIAIGDEQTLFIFGKKQLQRLYKEDKFHRITTATSKGFLLSLESAYEYAEKVLKTESGLLS